MSLLAHLLQFSSVNNYNREERSNSVNSRFLYEDDNNQDKSKKTLSKSLCKFNLPQNKIDAKSRILHRFTHRFSMKFRKYYYQFFVIMETLKNNNQKIKNNHKIITKQLSSDLLEIYNNKLNQFKQLYQILYSKRYQNILKNQIFQTIKIKGKLQKFITNISKVYQQRQIKYSKMYFISCLKDIEKQYIKIDILISAITNVKQYYQNTLDFNEKQQLRQCFIKLKSIPKKLEILIKQQDNFFNTSLKNSCFTIINSSFDTTFLSLRQPKTIQNILKTPRQKFNKLDSPKKYKRTNLRIIGQQSKLLWKTGIVLTNYLQQGINHQINIQSKPRMCAKVYPDTIVDQFQDLYDQTDLFLQFKNNRNQQKLNKNNDQFHKSHYQEQFKSKSLITYGFPLINSQSQSSISIKYKDNFNIYFGSQAVNFKNSLVCQRQAMKKQQQQYLKKNYNEPSYIKFNYNSNNSNINSRKISCQQCLNHSKIIHYDKNYDQQSYSSSNNFSQVNYKHDCFYPSFQKNDNHDNKNKKSYSFDKKLPQLKIDDPKIYKMDKRQLEKPQKCMKSFSFGNTNSTNIWGGNSNVKHYKTKDQINERPVRDILVSEREIDQAIENQIQIDQQPKNKNKICSDFIRLRNRRQTKY